MCSNIVIRNSLQYSCQTSLFSLCWSCAICHTKLHVRGWPICADTQLHPMELQASRRWCPASAPFSKFRENISKQTCADIPAIISKCPDNSLVFTSKNIHCNGYGSWFELIELVREMRAPENKGSAISNLCKREQVFPSTIVVGPLKV